MNGLNLINVLFHEEQLDEKSNLGYQKNSLNKTEIPVESSLIGINFDIFRNILPTEYVPSQQLGQAEDNGMFPK